MRGMTMTTAIELPFGSPIELEFAWGVVDEGDMEFVPKFGLTYEEVRSEAPKLLGPRRHSAKPVVFPQVRIAKYTVDFLVLGLAKFKGVPWLLSEAELEAMLEEG